MISEHAAPPHPRRAETRDVRIHPAILKSVIMDQAGTLAKAVLELVMNSIDAKCTRCDVEISPHRVIVTDDGIGMKTRKEIVEHFEVFGTPHTDAEQKRYGRFRMGRGQAFAYGKNTWRTGPFEMFVDIKGRGFSYDLTSSLERFKGCRIEVELNDVLDPSKVLDLADTVARWVRYAPVPVFVTTPDPPYVGGKNVVRDPTTEEWDHETDDAYIKLDASTSLEIYNLGIHVMTKGNYAYGTGGVIVSKQQLKVNFARNDLMSDCEVWQRIQPVVDHRAREKIKSKKTLNDGERQRLINILCRDKEIPPGIDEQPLFGLANGRWVSADKLFCLWRGTSWKFTQAPLGDRKADRVLQHRLAIVLSDESVDMFRGKGLGEILALAWKVSRGKAKPSYEVVSFDRIAQGLSNRRDLIPDSDLTDVEELWLRLARSTHGCIYRMEVEGGDWIGARKKARKLCVGESDTALAWTDGQTYIALDRKFLRSLKFDVFGFSELGRVLLHEYCHDEDDTNTHVHSIDFYQQFHDEADRIGDFARICLGKLPGMLKVLNRRMNKVALADQDRLFAVRRELQNALPEEVPVDGYDGGETEAAAAEAPAGDAQSDQG